MSSDRAYRLCQQLDVKCDASGDLALWVPAKKIFTPLSLDALRLLTAFGAPRSVADASRELALEIDDELEAAIGDYVALGLLLPADDEPPPERVPVVFSRITSIDLPVIDITATIAFYRDALGAWVADREGDVAVRFGETELVLRPSPSVSSTRIRLDARHDELDAALARVRRHGDVGAVTERAGLRRFEARDPSGHVVEIVERPIRTSRTLSQIAAMQFGEQPELPTSRHLRDRLPSWVMPFSRAGGASRPGLWAQWRQDYDAAIEDQEHLPWFAHHFDVEIAEALAVWAPLPGRFIELGCGPGTHAARLASLGYDTTAIDIVELRVRQADAVYGKWNPRLRFLVRDVLDAEQVASLGTFDYAFDRACYHVMGTTETRARYVRHCARLLRPGGRLFLKAMCDVEPGGWGPSRENAEDIAETFASHFAVVEQQLSSLESTLTHHPKAITFVLERRSDAE